MQASAITIAPGIPEKYNELILYLKNTRAMDETLLRSMPETELKLAAFEEIKRLMNAGTLTDDIAEVLACRPLSLEQKITLTHGVTKTLMNSGALSLEAYLQFTDEQLPNIRQETVTLMTATPPVLTVDEVKSLTKNQKDTVIEMVLYKSILNLILDRQLDVKKILTLTPQQQSIALKIIQPAGYRYDDAASSIQKLLADGIITTDDIIVIAQDSSVAVGSTPEVNRLENRFNFIRDRVLSLQQAMKLQPIEYEALYKNPGAIEALKAGSETVATITTKYMSSVDLSSAQIIAKVEATTGPLPNSIKQDITLAIRSAFGEPDKLQIPKSLESFIQTHHQIIHLTQALETALHRDLPPLLKEKVKTDISWHPALSHFIQFLKKTDPEGTHLSTLSAEELSALVLSGHAVQALVNSRVLSFAALVAYDLPTRQLLLDSFSAIVTLAEIQENGGAGMPLTALLRIKESNPTKFAYLLQHSAFIALLVRESKIVSLADDILRPDLIIPDSFLSGENHACILALLNQVKDISFTDLLSLKPDMLALLFQTFDAAEGSEGNQNAVNNLIEILNASSLPLFYVSTLDLTELRECLENSKTILKIMTESSLTLETIFQLPPHMRNTLYQKTLQAQAGTVVSATSSLASAAISALLDSALETPAVRSAKASFAAKNYEELIKLIPSIPTKMTCDFAQDLVAQADSSSEPFKSELLHTAMRLYHGRLTFSGGLSREDAPSVLEQRNLLFTQLSGGEPPSKIAGYWDSKDLSAGAKKFAAKNAAVIAAAADATGGRGSSHPQVVRTLTRAFGSGASASAAPK